MATGGNKKRSSKPDENYWNRAKMSGYAQTHKAKRIARRNKRCGKPANYTGSTGHVCPTNGGLPKSVTCPKTEYTRAIPRSPQR